MPELEHSVNPTDYDSSKDQKPSLKITKKEEPQKESSTSSEEKDSGVLDGEGHHNKLNRY